MNVFGIYDTACTGISFETLEARSKHQRYEAKMGENKDFLAYAEKSSLRYGILIKTKKNIAKKTS